MNSKTSEKRKGRVPTFVNNDDIQELAKENVSNEDGKSENDVTFVSTETRNPKKPKFEDRRDLCRFCGAVVFRVNRHYKWCNALTIRCHCRERFQTIDAFNEHMLQCPQNLESGSVGCNYCQRTFNAPEAMGAHCKIEHGQEYLIQSVILKNASDFRKWRERIEYENDIRFRHYGSTKVSKEGGIKMRCHEMFPMKKRKKLSMCAPFDTFDEYKDAVKGCSAFMSFIEMDNREVRVIYSLDHCHYVNYYLQSLSPITLRKIYRLYREGHELNELWEEMQQIKAEEIVPEREKLLTFQHLKLIFNNFKRLEEEHPDRAEKLVHSDSEPEEEANTIAFEKKQDDEEILSQEVRLIVNETLDYVRSFDSLPVLPQETTLVEKDKIKSDNINDMCEEQSNYMIEPLAIISRTGRRIKPPMKFTAELPDVKPRMKRCRNEKVYEVKDRIQDVQSNDNLSKEDLEKIELAKKLIDEVEHKEINI